MINWSHQANLNRFRIDIRVSYNCDVEFVIKILEESAREHAEVSINKNVEARLLSFGESSLNFQVLFYSSTIFRSDRMKSDIRRVIRRKFVENNIAIPFPQMDVHMKPSK